MASISCAQAILAQAFHVPSISCAVPCARPNRLPCLFEELMSHTPSSSRARRLREAATKRRLYDDGYAVKFVKQQAGDSSKLDAIIEKVSHLAFLVQFFFACPSTYYAPFNFDTIGYDAYWETLIPQRDSLNSRDDSDGAAGVAANQPVDDAHLLHDGSCESHLLLEALCPTDVALEAGSVSCWSPTTEFDPIHNTFKSSEPRGCTLTEERSSNETDSSNSEECCIHCHKPFGDIAPDGSWDGDACEWCCAPYHTHCLREVCNLKGSWELCHLCSSDCKRIGIRCDFRCLPAAAWNVIYDRFDNMEPTSRGDTTAEDKSSAWPPLDSNQQACFQDFLSTREASRHKILLNELRELSDQVEQAEALGQRQAAKAKLNHAKELQCQLETPLSLDRMRHEAWLFYDAQ